LLVEALYHAPYDYPYRVSEKIEELFNQALKPDHFTVGGAKFLLTRLEEDDECQESLSEELFIKVKESVRVLVRDVRALRLSAN
jgi:hypothetical protein